MRRSLAISGILAAGITVLAVSAAPAIAAGGPASPNGTGTCTSTGTAQGPMNGAGGGRGNGQGMQGQGNGQGMQGQGAITAVSGTLTASQRATLVAMAEEEKLAHDVYVALAAKYPATVQFARIANAEATHLTSIQTLLARYGIDDPTTGMAAGEFRTAAFQSLYDDLVARATTTANALAVGVTIEELDIADLTSAMSGLTAPDVLQVYTNLRNGSERHLAAFGG